MNDEGAPAPRRLVIVGGGIAGLSAARSARGADSSAEIILVSSERVPPYYRPDLSKNYLLDGYHHPRPEIASSEGLRAEGIVWKGDWHVAEIDLGNARIRGPRGEMAFDRLLLAPGATPVQLPVEGSELAGICTLRTVDDAKTLRARLRAARGVAIIGAGLIGLELAATARQLGKDVTVIEQASRVLMRTFPAEIAHAVTDHHERNGVRFLLGSEVRAFRGRVSLGAVETTSGDVAAELAIVAIGARPDISLASQAGIECDDGILVDEQCRTSASNVFAAGDAVRIRKDMFRRRFEAWRHAEEQGRVAGMNLVGGRNAYTVAPWFWSDQGDLHLQGCGSMSRDAEPIIRIGSDGCSRILFQCQQGRVIAGFGMSVGSGIANELPFLARLVSQNATASDEDLKNPDLPLKTIVRRALANRLYDSNAPHENG